MKIGIEAQRIFRPKKHGMDMVVLELIRNLQQIDHKNEYFIFVKPDIDHTAICEISNFHIIELKGGPYPTWEQFALPQAAKKYQCDILHCTSNTAPITTSIPTMITLHDIIYMESVNLLKKDGTWYQKLGNIYRRWNVPRVVKAAQVVITVSDFERERISRYFNLADTKLYTVYNGVGRHFKPITDENELSLIKEKYHLPDRFLFFLGNTDPKKNTRGVLKAFADFKKTDGANYKLVMPDYEENALMSLLEDLGCANIRSHIYLTGYIANTDLPGIINLCKIFLYPSLRESFGIPILEGMACGKPVITSNTSSMPEIAGEAAFIIDPFSPEQITSAIVKLLADPELCAELSDRGIQRAAFFSWENMARKVLNLYNQFDAKK